MTSEKTAAVLAAVFFIIFLFSMISGCDTGNGKPVNLSESPFISFRDIPGVTADEIAAIEKLRQAVSQKEHGAFVYGMTLSTEAFLLGDGENGGYTALFCEWLSGLFGIEFRPEIYEWNDMVEKINAGEIDFTGDMTRTEERLKTFYMTDSIAERQYKMMRLKGSQPLDRIATERPLRYAFLQDAITADIVAAVSQLTYDTIFVSNIAEAYQALENGDIDVFIGEGVSEASFDDYGNVYTVDFFPLIIGPVSMTTANEELAPIISVITKAQRNGAMPYLNNLYNQGYEEYKRHKFFMLLNDEEKAYLRNTASVPLAARSFNYPVDFYNSYEKKWDGIIFDILDKVNELTGLTFEVINEQEVNLSRLLGMVREGKAHIIPELLISEERKPLYLWMEHQFITDQYALLSKSHYPNVNINEISYKRVGVIKDTTRAELFRTWFPNAVGIIEYSIDEDAFRAMERGEIDLIMASKNRLLSILNYYELSDYKANYLFNYPYESTFGFNKDQTLLCSIMDKALPLIDTSAITEQWLTKTYDFRGRLLEAQRPWLIGAIALSFTVFALLLALLYRSHIDRKRIIKEESEAKTREADERAQIMFDTTPLSCIMLDKNLNILTCNETAVKLFKLSKKEDIQRLFVDLTPEYQQDGRNSQEAAYKTIMEAFDKGHSSYSDWMHSNMDGETFPCEVEIVRVEYGGEDVVAAYTRDMRAVKEAEARMHEADERAQIMFDTAPLAGCMFDKDFNMFDCNQETVRLFEIPDKEFYLKRFTELFPEYQPFGELSMERAYIYIRTAFEKGYHCFEWMYRKPSGELLPTEVTLARVKHRGEYMIAGYIRDLTEQKAKEQLIKIVAEKTSTLEAILDATPDLIICKDLNSRYKECNKAMEKFFNLSKSDIIGKDNTEALEMSPEYLAQYAAGDKKIFDEKQVLIFEEYIPSPDGKQVLFETIKTPLIQDGQVTGLVAICRDITRRKAAEEEARIASESKSQFLANMSHEIRTPMNAILGVTEIQLQNEDLLPDTKNALNIIYTSGYTLLGIINDLLDLSKIEAGKMDLINDRYETASLINDTINLNMTRLGSKAIDFKLHIDGDMPFELIGDMLRVKQILNNLLSNSFKYTDKGEVRLSLSTQISGDENAPKVTLTIIVSDTGQGMTGEQVKSLFDAYSRFNMKSNRFIEGTGLGMNIVQNLVKMMDGDISVKSEQGQGTEFTVNLTQGYAGPAKLGSEMAESLMGFRLAGMSKIKKLQIVREYMPYGKVLVVDDVETNLYVAKGFLLPYGLTVDTALSGMEAIWKIERDVYDIVFMDHMMPGMDGIETVQVIRSKGYTRPIVALTANAVAGQAEKFMANGFDGFISKPIDIRDLNASLNKFVRDSQPPEVIEAARAASSVAIASDNVTVKVDTELARIFAHDVEKAIAVLREYETSSYESADLRMYILNVHALKSALANIGETKLSIFAKELEKAGREKNTAYISEQTPAFLIELYALVDKLKQEKVQDGGEASEEDAVYLHMMIETVKEACADYDIDAAKAALAELKQKPLRGEYDELMDTIFEHLLHSDLDKAEEVCAAYLVQRA